MDWPADAVERRPVADLVAHARNARTHSAAQVAQIVASIREWGWTMPVLVDEAGVIIAGHGRILAAVSLGLDDVPVMVARGWTEEQKRAYRIADNKLALNAGWDDEILALELGELKELSFDVGLTGFSPDEFAALNARGSAGLTDPDEVPPVPEAPVSRAGDVWLLDKHRLACGDSTNADAVLALLAGAVPHLMVTDPPYGVDYDPAWRNRAGLSATGRTGKVMNDHRADWREAWALFPGNAAYVWHGALHAGTVAESLTAAGFEIRSQIIWAKERLVMGRGHYHWQHEPCWYAVRGKGHWAGDRKQTTLWSIPTRAAGQSDAATIHGTQKPVECMRRPMLNNSEPGQAIYEPFCGSGSTIIAAETVGWVCRATEISPDYCDAAVLRWQAFTGELAVFDGENLTIDDVATMRMTSKAATAMGQSASAA